MCHFKYWQNIPAKSADLWINLSQMTEEEEEDTA